MHSTSLALRVILPSVWFGLVGAISFLETPLKFLAPGITLEVGLGLGRIMFTTLNIAGLVLLVVITLASLRPRPTRVQVGLLGGLWLVLLAELLIIRPPLNARTDAVLAGADPGQSAWHYVYIAADLVLLALLAAFVVVSVRRLLDDRS